MQLPARQPSRFGANVLRLPLFLLLIGVFSASMMVPAIYGGVARDLEAARAFLYTAILGVSAFAMIGLAHAGRDPRHGALGPLMSRIAPRMGQPDHRKGTDAKDGRVKKGPRRLEIARHAP
ncbi:MAG: hypothetical protein AAFY90_02915, partial [Pseudomonadota bacterium]